MQSEVKILTSDEVSFMSDNQLQELKRKMQALLGKHLPLGRISFVFVVDLRQLKPYGENQSEILFFQKAKQAVGLSQHGIFPQQ